MASTRMTIMLLAAVAFAVAANGAAQRDACPSTSEEGDVVCQEAMPAGQVVVVVDPFSTGALVADEALKRSYKVVIAYSPGRVPNAATALKYYGKVDEMPTIGETAAAVKAAAGGLPIIACIVGSETGITLADELSVELQVRNNGIFHGGERRNKSVQQKAVKAAGLRVARHALGTKWHEVEAFVKNEPMPVVVKPVDSAGSDGVKLCNSVEEAKAHFQLLMKSQRKIRSRGRAVLCQEFLKGTEYAIDHVSRDGVHKTVMVWVYDKRPANGAAFVYYSTIPVDSSSAIAKTMIKYTRGVLDALKVDNGPTHAEVIMTSDGPALVEINCRCDGGDGAWVALAKRLTGGYSQVDVALDSHVNGPAFSRIPDVYPSPFKASGQTVYLVSLFSGTVMSTPGNDKMRQLSSFVSLQTGVRVGSRVELTVDLYTAVGSLVLANSDAKRLEADTEMVREMEREGLFTFDEQR